MQRTTRRNIPIALLMFFISFHLYPQCLVNGLVINKQTKSPLEFATAALYDMDSAFFKGSVTDATGAFQFDRVAPGRYTLEVRLIGFQTVHKQVDVGPSHTDAGVITLAETGVGLSEVAVTAAVPAVLQKAD
ncbi:MAG: carboxypeptidase regulatory-like domain-containing protein, partial [Hoylesella saccharolytica]